MDKKLLDLWNEYQKIKNPHFVPEGDIKHYDEGGSVEPSLADRISHIFSSTDPNTPALPSEDARQGTQDSMRKAFGYADGGQVEDESTLVQLGKKLKEAFEGPKPSPTPLPEPVETKYDRIRRQNRANFSANYADGGPVVDPNVAMQDPNPAPAQDPGALQNLYQRYLQATGQVKGSGMGDVQSADAPNRSLPVMTAGFADPQDDELAQGFKKQNQMLAKIGGDPSNLPSPHDQVEGFHKDMDMVGGMAGGVENVGAAKLEEYLAKNRASLADLKQNGPKYANEWKSKLQDLAHNNETISDPSLLIGQQIPEFRGRSHLKIVDVSKSPHSGEHFVRVQDPMGQGFNIDLNTLMHEIKPHGYAEGGQVQSMADGGVPKTPEELAEENAQGDVSLGMGEQDNPEAQNLTDNTGYAEEDKNAEDLALGPDEQDAEMADDSDEDAEKDQEADLSAPMAKENDKKVEAKRDEGVSEARKMDGMTLDKNEALAQNPMPSDPASGLQVNPALQRLINATSQQKNGLAEAQQQRADNIQGNQVMRGAQLIASGFSRTNPDRALKVIDENGKYANLPVQNYEETLQNQQNDPNSVMSQTARDYFKNTLHMQIPENASFADINKIAPYVTKQQGFQSAMQRALLNSQTKKDISDKSISAANKRAEDSNAIRKDSNKIHAQAVSATKQQNQDNKVNSDFEKMGKLTNAEIASSRSPFGKSANVLRSAEQIEAIGKQYDDLNGLDNRQISEIARSLDSMLSNGAATVTGSSHLIPKTSSGNLANIEEYISNLPKGAQQKEFVQRMLDTVAREKQVASQQMSRTQGKLLAPYAHLKKNYPDRYNDFLKTAGIPTEDQQNASERVNVIGPDGKRGTIPSSQLDAAIKQGYKKE